MPLSNYKLGQRIHQRLSFKKPSKKRYMVLCGIDVLIYC